MTETFYSEPPKELLGKILQRIREERRILVLRRITFLSLLLAGSLIGLVPSFKMLLSDFNQSGFLNFLSLMFSDFSSVATYWKSFSLILLQTLPAVSLVVFLAVLLVFLQAAKFLTKNIKIINQHGHRQIISI